MIFILLLKVFRVLAFSGQERTCHEPSRASLRDRSFRFRAGPGDGKSEVRASDVQQGAKRFLGGVQRGIVAQAESLIARFFRAQRQKRHISSNSHGKTHIFSKRAPRRLQDGPRALQETPRPSKTVPRWPKMASRRSKGAPRRPKRPPRGFPRGPQEAKSSGFP